MVEKKTKLVDRRLLTDVPEIRTEDIPYYELSNQTSIKLSFVYGYNETEQKFKAVRISDDGSLHIKIKDTDIAVPVDLQAATIAYDAYNNWFITKACLYGWTGAAWRQINVWTDGSVFIRPTAEFGAGSYSVTDTLSKICYLTATFSAKARLLIKNVGDNDAYVEVRATCYGKSEDGFLYTVEYSGTVSPGSQVEVIVDKPFKYVEVWAKTTTSGTTTTLKVDRCMFAN